MSQETKHLARIDVLRAFAVLLVFFSHFQPVVFGDLLWSWQGLWCRWNDDPSVLQILPRVYLTGATGVSLFFVISGLCIRLSHLSSPHFSTGHFYWRRFWRIYPPYLLCLGFWVVAYGVFAGKQFDWADIGSHLLLLHNAYPAYFTSINAPFWSLALEAQVYLLYPLLIAMHLRWGVLRTCAALLILSVASYALGGASVRTYLHLPPWMEAARQLPTTLWFTWYLGFLVANQLVSGERLKGWQRVSLALSGAALLPLAALCRPFFPIRAAAEGLLLASVVYEYLSLPLVRHVAARITVKWLTVLGLCSYSFYLYHYPVMIAIQQALKKFDWYAGLGGALGYWVPLTILLGANFALAYFLYLVVERPSLSFGKRLYQRHFAKPALAAQGQRPATVPARNAAGQVR